MHHAPAHTFKSCVARSRLLTLDSYNMIQKIRQGVKM